VSQLIAAKAFRSKRCFLISEFGLNVYLLHFLELSLIVNDLGEIKGKLGYSNSIEHLVRFLCEQYAHAPVPGPHPLLITPERFRS